MRAPAYSKRKAIVKRPALSEVIGEHWPPHITALSWEACELDHSDPGESDVNMTQVSQLELGGSDEE